MDDLNWRRPCGGEASQTGRLLGGGSLGLLNKIDETVRQRIQSLRIFSRCVMMRVLPSEDNDFVGFRCWTCTDGDRIDSLEQCSHYGNERAVE